MPHHDGTGRVKLTFKSLEKDGSISSEKTITVPTGVSAFDAASWNGIAIDSTCARFARSSEGGAQHFLLFHRGQIS